VEKGCGCERKGNICVQCRLESNFIQSVDSIKGTCCSRSRFFYAWNDVSFSWF